MSNLTQRLITGTIFVIVLVGCIWWNHWSMFFLFLLITGLGLNEFYTLAKKANAEPSRRLGITIGILVVTAALFMQMHRPFFHLVTHVLVPLCFAIFLCELWRKKSNPMGNIAWTFVGVIYVAVPVALLVRTFGPSLVHKGPAVVTTVYEAAPLLSLFILIWVSDSMAYVCGRMFGKHKLWERISPKKTWEGFIGGLLFCTATGSMLGYYWLSDHTLEISIMWGIIALVISITGMLGDLVESLFKRSIDVKDSGTILPGHGAILDRFDALFIATPFAITVYYLYPLLSQLVRFAIS